MIDHQDRDRTGLGQQRDRVMHRPGRLRAGVPADQHARPNGLELAGIGREQDRSTGLEQCGFDQRLAGGLRPIGRGLPDHHKIGVKPMRGHRTGGKALDEPPFTRDTVAA